MIVDMVYDGQKIAWSGKGTLICMILQKATAMDA